MSFLPPLIQLQISPENVFTFSLQMSEYLDNYSSVAFNM